MFFSFSSLSSECITLYRIIRFVCLSFFFLSSFRSFMGKGNAFVSRRKEKEEEEVTISYDDVEDLIGKESSLRAASSSLAPTVDSVASSSSEPSTSSSTSALFSPVSAEELRSVCIASSSRVFVFCCSSQLVCLRF